MEEEREEKETKKEKERAKLLCLTAKTLQEASSYYLAQHFLKGKRDLVGGGSSEHLGSKLLKTTLSF